MKIIKYMAFASFILSGLLLSQSVAAEVAVIVNPENTNSVTASEIKRIFLGKLKKFPDGSKVMPINQGNDATARQEFDRKVLGKSATQIKSYWAKVVFSGKGGPPAEMTNAAEVIEYVSQNANGIGYVETSELTDQVVVIATF